MAKIKSFGVALTVGGTAIGGLTDVAVSGTEVNFVDVTTHDSSGGYKEYVGGLKDGGTLELTGAYNIADTGQAYLRTHVGESKACIVTFSDDSTASFSAIVGGFATSNPLDDKVEFTCSLKITGAVTYAAAV